MLSSHPAPPRLLRRLLSAVLALSVMLTMLGRGHASCDESRAQHSAASPLGAHTGMEPAHDDALAGESSAAQALQGCADHDQHDERGTAECALVAHCAVGALASAGVVPVSSVVRLALTIEPTDSRRLDASYQPASPPPKA